MRTASPELYQDGTGLADFRVTSLGDSRPIGGTLAWIVLSHFGDLATVQGCTDLALLAEIRGVLEEVGLKYVDYQYLTAKVYDRKCAALVGLSWANRYFALVPEYKIAGAGAQ